VFDLDCVSLLEIARNLRDEHRFQSGRKITYARAYSSARRKIPRACPRLAAQRLAKKIAAGAQFIQTQYCYDLPLLRAFMQHVEELGLIAKYSSWGRRPAAFGENASGCASTCLGCMFRQHHRRLQGAQDQAREAATFASS